MLFIYLLLCISISSGTEQSQNENEDVHNLRNALRKATQIFTPERKNIVNSYLEETKLIQRNINIYDKLCDGIELFGEVAEKECSKHEDEMTDYIRNISLIARPPQHDTIQWYWSQQSIWRKLETKFVCFESIHFQNLMNCLCSFCSWPFVVQDEKYDIYTKWKNEYELRECQKRTHKSFMKTGESVCTWMNITVGNKGEKIAKKIKQEMDDESSKTVQQKKSNGTVSVEDIT
eukprot:UN12046